MQQPRRTPAMYPLGAQARAASASLTDPVQVVLVERDRMARLGLSQVLAVAGMRVTGAVGLIREAEHLPASTAADVVLTGADVPDIDDMEGIGRLLTRFSRARVVVLSSDESPTLIAAAVRNGADGFLSRDIPAQALVRALHGVARGEAALPRALLSVLVDAIRQSKTAATVDLDTVLSPRERDVLVEIARGRSNAEIAVRLGLKESTVKTHVSSILRKTGARSRFALHTPHPRGSA